MGLILFFLTVKTIAEEVLPGGHFEFQISADLPLYDMSLAIFLPNIPRFQPQW
jgi:hypothetical protein